MRITRAADTALSAIFLFMLGLNFTQVIFRYVLNKPLTWSEEVSIFLMIATVFLGMALLVLDRDHITIDLISGIKSQKLRRFFDLIGIVATGVILAVLSYLSYEYVLSLIARNTTSTALRIPMWVPVGTMLVGTVASLVFTVKHLLDLAKSVKAASDE